jgi:hypothetical protein
VALMHSHALSRQFRVKLCLKVLRLRSSLGGIQQLEPVLDSKALLSPTICAKTRRGVDLGFFHVLSPHLRLGCGRPSSAEQFFLFCILN